MKWIILVSILLTGCSTTQIKEAASNYIVEHDLDKKVSSVCYDLIDKKDCPSGWLQYDINVLPIIPVSSRFCFSIAKPPIVYPYGMACYTYDIIGATDDS